MCVAAKSFSKTVVGGSLEDVRRVLKGWVLLGHAMPSREVHMAVKHKNAMVGALQSGALLSEPELDSIAMASADSLMTAPFKPAEAPSSSGASSSAGNFGGKKKGAGGDLRTRMTPKRFLEERT